MTEDERPRVIVCGTRTMADAVLVNRTLSRLLKNLENPIICTGAAKGADALAEDWAYSKRITVKRFHANWSKGKGAGPERNREMAAYAAERRPCFCVAFRIAKGDSPGTDDMIATAKRMKFKLKVILYGADE